jgi:hypothetical protein
LRKLLNFKIIFYIFFSFKRFALYKNVFKFYHRNLAIKLDVCVCARLHTHTIKIVTVVLSNYEILLHMKFYTNITFKLIIIRKCVK